MGCKDKCRPEFFGHAYHWSEILTLIMLLTCAVLGFLNETKLLNGVDAFVLWIICASIAFLGNIFLWNIGWVESDAAYSRKISNEGGFLPSYFSLNFLASLVDKRFDLTSNAFI